LWPNSESLGVGGIRETRIEKTKVN
jgi:hypothetical protein